MLTILVTNINCINFMKKISKKKYKVENKNNLCKHKLLSSTMFIIEVTLTFVHDPLMGMVTLPPLIYIFY